MKTYQVKDILVPTDFSSISRHGLHHAEQIARPARARITLLNIVEPMGGSAGTSGMLRVSERLEEEKRQANAKRLERLARAAMKRSNVPVRALAIIGRVAPMVEKAARETRSDLIIMGTHGASGFVENLIGSNTYRIASLTRVPLMGVHKKMRQSGYSNIVYPVREQARAMDKFTHAVMFAKLFKARVQIIGLLHQQQKEHEEVLRARCAAVQQRFARHKIVSKAEYTYQGFFPDAVIRHAHPGSLVVIVQDADFHLVELFQGTFTKKVLHSILTPVLVVPSGHS